MEHRGQSFFFDEEFEGRSVFDFVKSFSPTWLSFQNLQRDGE